MHQTSTEVSPGIVMALDPSCFGAAFDAPALLAAFDAPALLTDTVPEDGCMVERSVEGLGNILQQRQTHTHTHKHTHTHTPHGQSHNFCEQSNHWHCLQNQQHAHRDYNAQHFTTTQAIHAASIDSIRVFSCSTSDTSPVLKMRTWSFAISCTRPEV